MFFSLSHNAASKGSKSVSWYTSNMENSSAVKLANKFLALPSESNVFKVAVMFLTNCRLVDSFKWCHETTFKLKESVSRSRVEEIISFNKFTHHLGSLNANTSDRKAPEDCIPKNKHNVG